MTTNEIVRIAADIIYSNEGNYGTVNKNDNGAVSIGKVQWHANRALNLLKDIVESIGTDAAKGILGKQLYEELVNCKNWEKRVVTTEEAAKISRLLISKQGKEKQDRLALNDIEGYVRKGEMYGLKDAGALVYFSDGVNQYGTNSSLWKSIALGAIKGSGGVEAMFSETKRLTTKYMTRRTRVYKRIKELGLSKYKPISVKKTYKVKAGDNLTKIAKQFNTTIDKLVSLNGIKNKNLIKVGQVIKVE